MNLSAFLNLSIYQPSPSISWSIRSDSDLYQQPASARVWNRTDTETAARWTLQSHSQIQFSSTLPDSAQHAHLLPRPLPRPAVRPGARRHRHRHAVRLTSRRIVVHLRDLLVRLARVGRRAERDLAGTHAFPRLEELGALDEAALGVLAAVDEVGVVEREFGGAVDDVVRGLDAEHEGVVLVADLVAPAAEAAARVDALGFELGEQLLEDAFALEGRGRVAVVEAAVVGAHDLVGGLEHFRVDEAADAVCEHVGVVDGLHRGFGHFEHDGPVGARLWGFEFGGFAGCELEGGEFLGGLGAVVGGVVGEDGGAVEWAVVFGEIQL